MMQSRFFCGLIALVAAVLITFGTGHGLMRQIESRVVARDTPVLLYIEPGWTVRDVAAAAKEIELVKQAWHFRLLSRWKSADRFLFAGEYEIPVGADLASVLDQIRNQRTFKRRVVVPEGASVVEVKNILENSFGLDMTGFQLPPEGSLLPETYFYERGDTAPQLIERMQTAMSVALDEFWMMRVAGLPLSSPEEAVVLASIIEKETAISSERRQVAAVFINRLNKNMRLQTDPTVIYGLTRGLPLGRALTRADLRSDTDFNTYRLAGLPPTPIANPGIASLEAALNPAAVSYLYFVADGSGGHAFADTLEEHNRNVARWRQIQKGTP